VNERSIAGVTDHYATDDIHAIEITRRIVANLNVKKEIIPLTLSSPKEPLFDPNEIYGIVPSDSKKLWDIKKVIARIVDNSEFDEFKQLYGTTLVTGFVSSSSLSAYSLLSLSTYISLLFQIVTTKEISDDFGIVPIFGLQVKVLQKYTVTPSAL